MPEPADLLGGMVALLLDDAAIAAIVDTRVFAGELPADQAELMPRAAIELHQSGGTSLTGGSNAEHDTQRIDLFAYAATPREADQLRAAAALAFRRVQPGVRGNCYIHSIVPAGGASSTRDPDAAWPRAFQSFQVFHALGAVN